MLSSDSMGLFLVFNMLQAATSPGFWGACPGVASCTCECGGRRASGRSAEYLVRGEWETLVETYIRRLVSNDQYSVGGGDLREMESQYERRLSVGFQKIDTPVRLLV